ncbi:TetR family transcriptional regulator [Brevibacterium sp. FAM 24638]|uniref:TetR/AcrR family transcriptional regulator n=1 Tax=Brevibacterium sp. FAM 24638 TaxID=3415681 RepID=UPI003C7AB647
MTDTTNTPDRNRRPGRRAGSSNSRSLILEAALDQFATTGYGRTSIRSIASAAEVDPSLITHFFGTKEGLLAESLSHLDRLPVRIRAALTRADPDKAETLARTYFGAWEDASLGPRLRALARAAAESPSAATVMREALETHIFTTLEANSTPRQFAHMQVAMSQLFGTAFARYILEIHPLADLGLEELVDHVAPILRSVFAEAESD